MTVVDPDRVRFRVTVVADFDDVHAVAEYLTRCGLSAVEVIKLTQHPPMKVGESNDLYGMVTIDAIPRIR